MGGKGGWAARGGPYLPIGPCGVAMNLRSVGLIGSDKPGGPKRHLTNTGVNVRPIPPIQCPPWVPLEGTGWEVWV